MGIFNRKKIDTTHVEMSVDAGFEQQGRLNITNMKPGDKIVGFVVDVTEEDSKRFKNKIYIYKIHTEEGMIALAPGQGFHTLYGEWMKPGNKVCIGYKGRRQGSDKVWYHDYAFGVDHAASAAKQKELFDGETE